MRSFVTGSVVWVVLLASWFFFVFQFSLSELLIGAVAASLTLFAIHRTLCVAPLDASVRLPWLSTLCYIPAASVHGTSILIQALWRFWQGKPSGSVWQTIPFHPVGTEDEKRGRRALTTLLTTLTPNSYVIDTDLATELMLIHTLKNDPVAKFVRTLEIARVNGMNPWLASALVLLLLMVPCCIVCLRGDIVNRLIGLEAGSALAAIVLLLLAEGYGRASFVDVALTMALLAFGGGLVFARFLERWL